MPVTVKLFATLQKNRFDVRGIEIPEGISVRGLIQRMGIPETEVALIFINNTHAGPDTILKDNDTLALFPPVGGG